MAFMQRKASSLYLPVQRDAFGGGKIRFEWSGSGSVCIKPCLASISRDLVARQQATLEAHVGRKGEGNIHSRRAPT